MPVRQDVQGGSEAPGLRGYEGAGVARAQMQQPGSLQVQDRSGFWGNILKRADHVSDALENKQRAEDYLTGQQDNLLGKERQSVHKSMSEEYEQGYNRAQVGTDLSKFQLSLQQEAVAFVNEGRTPEEWQAHVKEKTDGLLTAAGNQGMDLNNRDWQTWLSGVQSTRDTAADLYQTKNVERAQYQKGQAIAAEGNAAIATFMAADEAGNPLQALGNLTSHIERVYTDPTLSPQQRDATFGTFSQGVMTAAKTSKAVEGVSAYLQALPQFKALPTQVQTQIMAGAQQQYERRAADESTEVYGYVSQARAINDPAELERLYPMPSFIERLNEAQQTHKITPSQYFGMVEEENTRRLKLGAAVRKQDALLKGTTLSDISTTTGDTIGKVKTAITEVYAQTHGGYSGGGLALMQRGLQSGAGDLTGVGIEMLQQDAQSLANIDARQLKTGPDGQPLYPATVVNSLTNIKTAYDAALKAGNSVQAEQLVAGLPDAVAYGVRQASDSNSMAQVVYGRANDLAAGRVVSLPARMDNALLATTEDVTAGLFDTNLTQKGTARNILGVKAYVFNSKEDELVQQSRLAQVNGAISEEYTSLYQQGKLPALDGENLKKTLIGRVSARTVRVEDGTDNGSLLILPPVANKEAIFGSVDNNIIGQGLQEHISEFKTRNPSARNVQMRYDPMAGELVLAATDQNNVLLTTPESLSTQAVRDSVRAVEAGLTNGGQGKTAGALAVPGAGFVDFNAGNRFGIQPQVFTQAVNQLVSYEGYTANKGFSILATHPTTGAALNEEKYVKQPTDSPQQAANKLSMYLNDKVLPQVMGKMPAFQQLPEYLRQQVFSQMVETTYHAGNSDAFGNIIQTALNGDTAKAYEDFRNSALFKDAGGADVRRNKDRFKTLDAVSQFSRVQRTGY